jgi:hypothetical protein
VAPEIARPDSKSLIKQILGLQIPRKDVPKHKPIVHLVHYKTRKEIGVAAISVPSTDPWEWDPTLDPDVDGKCEYTKIRVFFKLLPEKVVFLS